MPSLCANVEFGPPILAMRTKSALERGEGLILDCRDEEWLCLLLFTKANEAMAKL